MEQDKSLPDFGRIPSLEELNDRSKNTLVSNLGIEYTEVKQGKVIAQMPVDERTKQPMGILHGGASLALAETVAGLGSMCLIDINTQQARGI
ncbi:MAG: hotdog fold thioesterase, partial [Bacteroidota bacterium]|nr:hotdog fold thioesterase [Bacteroidota bacterium]